MSSLTAFFASRWGIISAGIFIGALAPILQHLGNPPRPPLLKGGWGDFRGRLSNPSCLAGC